MQQLLDLVRISLIALLPGQYSSIEASHACDIAQRAFINHQDQVIIYSLLLVVWQHTAPFASTLPSTLP